MCVACAHADVPCVCSAAARMHRPAHTHVRTRPHALTPPHGGVTSGANTCNSGYARLDCRVNFGMRTYVRVDGVKKCGCEIVSQHDTRPLLVKVSGLHRPAPAHSVHAEFEPSTMRQRGHTRGRSAVIVCASCDVARVEGCADGCEAERARCQPVHREFKVGHVRASGGGCDTTNLTPYRMYSRTARDRDTGR